MTAKLTLADIADLRAYEREREEFRSAVIAMKRARRVPLGPIATIVFENATTVRFQIQEMARVERLITDEAIQAELDAYNPLVPAPGQLSMTLFIELTTDEELRRWLPALVGIERAIEVVVGDAQPIAAEPEAGHASQLTRDEVTASVHYVKAQLDQTVRTRFATEPVVLRVVHPAYRHEIILSDETKASLLEDWRDV